MKIALISTYMNSCPPKSYGGEIYYWGLAKSLSDIGHEVWLFAPGGSEKPQNGKLFLIRSSKRGVLSWDNEEWVYQKYKDIFLEADIIHDCSLSHIVAEKLKYYHGKTNIINTINGSVYCEPRPPFNVVTGSMAWQAEALANGLKTEMIYWGIDETFYTPSGNKEDYYLWIARFHPSKGLDLALDLAEYLGINLVVAGSTNFSDHEKYFNQYKPRIDGIPNVKYVKLPLDNSHHEAKRELYRKAKAFLYPVNYFECFGLVVCEAMACGTPVITTPNGAMPELVDNGQNGFICYTRHDFTKAILNGIPDAESKKHLHNGFNLWNNARIKAEQFTWRKAAEQYVLLYEKVLNGYTW